MRKFQLVGASTFALAVALASGDAAATPAGPRVVSVHVADYNAAQVKTADGILTVPAGLATYTVNSGSLEINSRFTVTLPPSFTFGSQPSLSVAGASTTVFTLSAGGIGAQSVTFVVGGAPLTSADGANTATLNSFAVSGATALETLTPVAVALPISMQSTNNAEIDNNDPSPLSQGAFASEPGVIFAWEPSLVLIDLSAPALGTAFYSYLLDNIPNGFYTAPPDLPTAGILAYQIAVQSKDAATGTVDVLSPSGAPNTISTSDTATLTVAGAFNGIAAAFSSDDQDCKTQSTAGSVTPTTITITGVPYRIGEGQVLCITANGTSLLQPDLAGFSPVLTPGTSTDFLAPTSLNLADGDPGLVSYTGGGIISVTNFFTGDDSGYSSLLRVNNAGTGPATLYALVQPDTGGAALTGLLGSLAGGTGTVFSEAQIQAVVPGLDLANSGQRSTLQLIVAGTVALSDQQAAKPDKPFAATELSAGTMGFHLSQSTNHPKAERFLGGFGEVAATGLLVNPTGAVTVMPGAAAVELPR